MRVQPGKQNLEITSAQAPNPTAWMVRVELFMVAPSEWHREQIYRARSVRLAAAALHRHGKQLAGGPSEHRRPLGSRPEVRIYYQRAVSRPPTPYSAVPWPKRGDWRRHQDRSAWRRPAPPAGRIPAGSPVRTRRPRCRTSASRPAGPRPASRSRAWPPDGRPLPGLRPAIPAIVSRPQSAWTPCRLTG